MANKTSIQDIANALEISKTTVSFVLNGKGDEKNISRKTQQRILDLVEKLDYRPNKLAQSLKTGNTMSVAYVVPDIANPFFAKIGRKIEDLITPSGYQLLIGSTDESPEKELNLVNTFLNRQVDGLIVASCLKQSALLETKIKQQFPIVFFDRNVDIKAAQVTVENTKAMEEAVGKLVKKGYKRIGLISLTPDNKPLKQRIEGYRACLLKNGFPIHSSWIHTLSPAHIKTEIPKITDACIADNLDALVFTNNLVASETLWHLNKRHSEIFQKLGYATFDNLDTFDYMIPKIISVAQPVDEIASKIAQNILLQLDKKPFKAETLILNPKLIVR